MKPIAMTRWLEGRRLQFEIVFDTVVSVVPEKISVNVELVDGSFRSMRLRDTRADGDTIRGWVYMSDEVKESEH